MIKTFRGKNKGKPGSLIKFATDAIALLAHTNSQLTHQQKFALASNLDETYQLLAKNKPHRSEQIFGNDLPKRIHGIKNNEQLFRPKKLQKVS